MTLKSVKLFKPFLLKEYVSVYYTSPALTSTIVKKVSFNNVSSQVVEVYLYSVTDGETESMANLILKRKIAAGESLDFFGAANDVLEPGDRIMASASIEDAVNIRASGAQIVNS